MDKYEYKVRAEEIKTLISKKEYTQAVKLADTIDWSRVRSVLMLCTVSDLYKINRRLEESRDILLMAYERNPDGRTIVYSLCELSIKLGDVVQAVEYYKEYVQLAPKDTGRYILQYKLYEAQEVSLEERIAVLEEFKKRDYREKWAYELAYLYHRVGLATRCVEECDDLILWFGEGKYVMKAMELKTLHEPLSAVQQKRYNLMRGIDDEAQEEEPLREFEEEHYVEQGYSQEHYVSQPEIQEEAELDIQVKPMRVGQYDTINLQKELAENMKAFLTEEQNPQEERSTALEEITYREDGAEPDEEEMPEPGSMTEEIVARLFENTGEIKQITPQETSPGEEEDAQWQTSTEYDTEYDAQEETGTEEAVRQAEEPQAEEIFFEDHTAELPGAPGDELNPEIASMLSQEYDGQISLVVPEAEKVEKQITGQMSIEDILTEWERMKRENEQKRAEDVRKRVQQQTGAMFSEFDASTRNGILEQLEEAAQLQARREAGQKTALFEDEPYGEETDGEAYEEYTGEEDVTEEDAGEPDEIEKSEEIRKSDEIEEPDEVEETDETGEPDEIEETDETAEPDEIEETDETEEPDEIEELEEIEEPETFAEEEAGLPEETEPEKDAEPKKGAAPVSRNLTPEEREAFGGYIQTKKEMSQVAQTIDAMSLAPCTGNVIITGDLGVEKVELAKDLIKEVQQTDANFSGKVAKISGKALNSKDVAATLARIQNGALIIEKAGDLKPETLRNMNKVLEKDGCGIIILMEDTKKAVDHMLDGCDAIKENFNARIDIEALNNDALVAYGKKYAYEQEYSVDELGRLALYTRIADMQTSEHVVTASEVRDIMEEAIESANRKSLGHFKDILFAKRYDGEDMVVLREKDFLE